MQKAYDQSGHLCLGVTGLAITDAMDGERDPARLAALAHPRIEPAATP